MCPMRRWTRRCWRWPEGGGRGGLQHRRRQQHLTAYSAYPLVCASNSGSGERVSVVRYIVVQFVSKNEQGLELRLE